MRLVLPLILLCACLGKDFPSDSSDTEPSEVTTEAFLAQFDLVATNLDALGVDFPPSDIALVSLTVLDRSGDFSSSVRAIGAVENRGAGVVCRIDFDFALLGSSGSTLWDSSTGIAGSTLDLGAFNSSRCLRPGERGHFFDIELIGISETPTAVVGVLDGDEESAEEPATMLVSEVTRVDQTGNGQGMVEVSIQNTGAALATDLRAQVFVHAADGTFTDWDLDSSIGQLGAGEVTSVVFSGLRVSRDGEAVVYLDWD